MTAAIKSILPPRIHKNIKKETKGKPLLFQPVMQTITFRTEGFPMRVMQITKFTSITISAELTYLPKMNKAVRCSPEPNFSSLQLQIFRSPNEDTVKFTSSSKYKQC